MVIGYEICPDFRGDLASTVRVLIGDADPIDGAMACRYVSTKKSDAAGANDGQADSFRLSPHSKSPRFKVSSKQSPNHGQE
jgi:hypothetical protein